MLNYKLHHSWQFQIDFSQNQEWYLIKSRCKLQMFLFSLHFVFEMTTESYITRVIIILILKHIISHHFHRACVLNKMQFKIGFYLISSAFFTFLECHIPEYLGVLQWNLHLLHSLFWHLCQSCLDCHLYFLNIYIEILCSTKSTVMPEEPIEVIIYYDLTVVIEVGCEEEIFLTFCIQLFSNVRQFRWNHHQ